MRKISPQTSFLSHYPVLTPTHSPRISEKLIKFSLIVSEFLLLMFSFRKTAHSPSTNDDGLCFPFFCRELLLRNDFPPTDWLWSADDDSWADLPHTASSHNFVIWGGKTGGLGAFFVQAKRSHTGNDKLFSSGRNSLRAAPLFRGDCTFASVVVCCESHIKCVGGEDASILRKHLLLHFSAHTHKLTSK